MENYQINYNNIEAPFRYLGDETYNKFIEVISISSNDRYPIWLTDKFVKTYSKLTRLRDAKFNIQIEALNQYYLYKEIIANERNQEYFFDKLKRYEYQLEIKDRNEYISTLPDTLVSLMLDSCKKSYNTLIKIILGYFSGKNVKTNPYPNGYELLDKYKNGLRRSISLRLDNSNRLVYKYIPEYNQFYIYSLMFHYDDEPRDRVSLALKFMYNDLLTEGIKKDKLLTIFKNDFDLV